MTSIHRKKETIIMLVDDKCIGKDKIKQQTSKEQQTQCMHIMVFRKQLKSNYFDSHDWHDCQENTCRTNKQQHKMKFSSSY